MSLPIRPLALSLTIALLGVAGMVSAAPAPAGMQDPQPRAERHAPPVQAHPQNAPAPRQQARPPRQARPRHEDPLSDSIRRVERRTRGQVIGAERVPYEGRSVSRVKVVDDDGRVRIYMDDPQAAAGDPRTRRDDD